MFGVRGPIIQVAGRPTRVNRPLVPLRTLSSWILGAPPTHFRGASCREIRVASVIAFRTFALQSGPSLRSSLNVPCERPLITLYPVSVLAVESMNRAISVHLARDVGRVRERRRSAVYWQTHAWERDKPSASVGTGGIIPEFLAPL